MSSYKNPQGVEVKYESCYDEVLDEMYREYDRLVLRESPLVEDQKKLIRNYELKKADR